MSESIEETLKQRGSAYGDFREQARITQAIKDAMRDSPNWNKLPPYLKEGLDMMAHKAARMLNGDPLYDDNMHDIIGYTKLMQDRARQDRENGVEFKTSDPMYDLDIIEEAYRRGGEAVIAMDIWANGSARVEVVATEVRKPEFFNDPVRAYFANLNSRGK